MVEIIRDSKELNKNVNLSIHLNNDYLQEEYDKFRKKIIKALRIIYLFRKKKNNEKYAEKLTSLRKDAKENIRQSNNSIDRLIRKNLITIEMASSLLNDYTNVNDLIKNLIDVAELLYDEKDSLLENE